MVKKSEYNECLKSKKSSVPNYRQRQKVCSKKTSEPQKSEPVSSPYTLTQLESMEQAFKKDIENFEQKERIRIKTSIKNTLNSKTEQGFRDLLHGLGASDEDIKDVSCEEFKDSFDFTSKTNELQKELNKNPDTFETYKKNFSSIYGIEKKELDLLTVDDFYEINDEAMKKGLSAIKPECYK